MTRELKLWTNGTDFVIEGSAEAARQCAIKHMGYDESEAEGADGEWRQYDDETFTMVWDDTKPDPSVKQTKSVAQWIAEHGCGYLACTEY